LSELADYRKIHGTAMNISSENTKLANGSDSKGSIQVVT
jgi:hypothetical protein